LLRGEESVKGYREVLSKIHYFNTRPDTYSKRIYSVQCAMLKGRVLSNELVITNFRFNVALQLIDFIDWRLCCRVPGIDWDSSIPSAVRRLADMEE
uniref:RNA-directed RNA polymerase n=1 Tax=Heligmosomoides polygyrus TaxID=6339 RepID=A0A183GTZ8_HELPZ